MGLGPAEGQRVVVGVTAGGPMQLYQRPFVYSLGQSSISQRWMILVLDADGDRIPPTHPLIIGDGEFKRECGALWTDLRSGERRLHRRRVGEGYKRATGLHPLVGEGVVIGIVALGAIQCDGA